MILCVTLNPCLDKTLIVPPWSPGDNVRGFSVREVVGGKGNNVARALKRLGHRDVRAVTFLGGAVGQRCEELLRDEDGIDAILIPTAAPTREILTVRTEETAVQSAFFDPDPAITAEEAARLLQTVDDLLSGGDVRALTLSGSSPSPATHGVYRELVERAATRGVPSFLDTYGPALRAMGVIRPTVLQMNMREAGMFLETGRRPTEEELGRVLELGLRVTLVTDGPNPFLARVDGRTYRVTPPRIEVVNPIGSGDCSLAGLVDAFLSDGDAEAILRRSVGCAAANASVWDAGGFETDEARRLASLADIV